MKLPVRIFFVCLIAFAMAGCNLTQKVSDDPKVKAPIDYGKPSFETNFRGFYGVLVDEAGNRIRNRTGRIDVTALSALSKPLSTDEDGFFKVDLGDAGWGCKDGKIGIVVTGNNNSAWGYYLVTDRYPLNGDPDAESDTGYKSVNMGALTATTLGVVKGSIVTTANILPNTFNLYYSSQFTFPEKGSMCLIETGIDPKSSTANVIGYYRIYLKPGEYNISLLPNFGYSYYSPTLTLLNTVVESGVITSIPTKNVEKK